MILDFRVSILPCDAPLYLLGAIPSFLIVAIPLLCSFPQPPFIPKMMLRICDILNVIKIPCRHPILNMSMRSSFFFKETFSWTRHRWSPLAGNEGMVGGTKHTLDCAIVGRLMTCRNLTSHASLEQHGRIVLLATFVHLFVHSMKSTIGEQNPTLMIYAHFESPKNLLVLVV